MKWYNKIPRIPVAACCPMRYLIGIECFVGLTINYIMRYCITLAMLKMVNSSPHKNKIDPNACPDTRPEGSGNTTYKGDFEWTEIQQGQIFSNFFVGYMIFMIPAGMLGDILGGHPIITLGSLITSTLSVLTPLAAHNSYITLSVLRVFVGVAQAMFYAPLHCIVAEWIPPKERATWSAIVFSGAHAGNFFNGIITGSMLGYLKLHWSWVFYVHGCCGFLWTFIFLFTTYSYPHDCPRLSEKEKKVYEDAGMVYKPHSKKSPWGPILKNWPVWAIVFGMIGHDWGLFMLVHDLPKFMYSILHFNIGANGYLNALIFLSIWAVGNLSGPLTDVIERKKLMSTSWNRKMGTTIASVGPSLGLVLSVYTNCSVTLALVALFIGSALMGFFYTSLKVSPIDIAPRYSGVIGAIAHTAGALAGYVVPSAVGAMVPNSSLSEWRLVMWVTFAVMSVTNVFYIFFASAEVQAFNSEEDAQRVQEEKEKKKEEKLAKKSKKRSSASPAPATSNAEGGEAA